MWKISFKIYGRLYTYRTYVRSRKIQLQNAFYKNWDGPTDQWNVCEQPHN